MSLIVLSALFQLKRNMVALCILEQRVRERRGLEFRTHGKSSIKSKADIDSRLTSFIQTEKFLAQRSLDQFNPTSIQAQLLLHLNKLISTVAYQDNRGHGALRPPTTA